MSGGHCTQRGWSTGLEAEDTRARPRADICVAAGGSAGLRLEPARSLSSTAQRAAGGRGRAGAGGGSRPGSRGPTWGAAHALGQQREGLGAGKARVPCPCPLPGPWCGGFRSRTRASPGLHLWPVASSDLRSFPGPTAEPSPPEQGPRTSLQCWVSPRGLSRARRNRAVVGGTRTGLLQERPGRGQGRGPALGGGSLGCGPGLQPHRWQPPWLVSETPCWGWGAQGYSSVPSPPDVPWLFKDKGWPPTLLSVAIRKTKPRLQLALSHPTGSTRGTLPVSPSPCPEGLRQRPRLVGSRWPVARLSWLAVPHGRCRVPGGCAWLWRLLQSGPLGPPGGGRLRPQGLVCTGTGGLWVSRAGDVAKHDVEAFGGSPCVSLQLATPWPARLAPARRAELSCGQPASTVDAQVT